MVRRFNEGKMESLFGYNSVDKTGGDGKKDLLSKDVPQFVRILDPKKAQNLAISLRALSVSPEEVCSAVKEGEIGFLPLLIVYMHRSLNACSLVTAYLFYRFF